MRNVDLNLENIIAQFVICLIKTQANNNFTVKIVECAGQVVEKTFFIVRHASVVFQMLLKLIINAQKMLLDVSAQYACKNNFILLNNHYSSNVVIQCISPASKT